MHPKSWTNFWGCIFFMRKKGTRNKNYSPEFKISVILDMRNNHLSYSETVRKYWGTQTKAETANYRFTLRNWERIYLEEGEIGFMEEKRGRKSTGTLKLFNENGSVIRRESYETKRLTPGETIKMDVSMNLLAPLESGKNYLAELE